MFAHCICYTWWSGVRCFSFDTPGLEIAIIV